MTQRGQKIVYNIIAIVAFGILLLMGPGKEKLATLLAEEPPTVTEGYDIVVLGDSIMGRIRDESSVTEQLAGMLDRSVFNGALGGTCMGRLSEEAYGSNVKDAMSMVSLSKSIAAGDFRVQQVVEIEDNGTEYFSETIAELAEIDFSKVEILLIEHCANDYHAGEVIYDEENPYNEATFAGALRSSVMTLQKAYPDLRIVLVTAPYTWYTVQELTCEEYVLGGNVLEDYVNAQLAAAQELGIEVIDVYHDVFPHEAWEDWQIYSADGLHPNEAGRTLLAEKIAEYFFEHPTKP